MYIFCREPGCKKRLQVGQYVVCAEDVVTYDMIFHVTFAKGMEIRLSYNN